MQYSTCYDRYFEVFCYGFFRQILPWQWFKAQAIAESDLDPAAISPAGAVGLMQLMPGTAAEMAKKLGIENTPQVLHINIRLGIAYDRQCWDIWKKESGIERVRFMLGSYNAGPGSILDAQRLASKKGLPTDQWQSIAAVLPEITGDDDAPETINYVAKIERIFRELTTKERSK